ncbi:cytochrome c peroxidase [Pelagicoccus sp. SDUM812005]|uniref:cytochrome-c peroxidase n=1 Tax=Pelagicoccus sp. SDUM812005 TaxID=3041257 RepID=UPI002810B065|nr:cytochrome c peroxidase [Pelagicoccus sp. SDUM812005]
MEEAKALFSTPDVDTIEYPDWEPPSAEVVELGRRLFFDEKLSVNETQSCATCHNPDHGFSDGLKFSIGAMGNPVGRNTPHLYNLAWNDTFFWDGRSHSLEDQALGPIKAEGEMNMPIDLLVERLSEDESYRHDFESAYGEPSITPDRIATSIASFERTIVVDDTPFDRYLAGDDRAISPAAVRGMQLYAGKALCIDCHDGANFTDNSFHNIGVEPHDSGRGAVVGDDSLKGAFKVPGLRNILYSAPYMHDGSLGTLEKVVRFYNVGGHLSQEEGSSIQPLNLTEGEIRDLVAFLGALNQPLNIARPAEVRATSEGLARSE